jgi:hypothetical protein
MVPESELGLAITLFKDPPEEVRVGGVALIIG